VLPGVNFTNMFTSSFYAPRSQKHKKTVKSPVSFCIPKAQKKTDNLTVFSALSGSALVKAASKKIVKIVTWAQFHQHSTYSFYACRSQKHKKTLMTSLYFLRFRDLRAQKLYKERWWNWHLIVKKLVKLLPDCKVSFKSESNNKKNWSTHRDVNKGHRKSSHISPQTWKYKISIILDQPTNLKNSTKLHQPTKTEKKSINKIISAHKLKKVNYPSN